MRWAPSVFAPAGDVTMKKAALVIAPGRGTYNREELGYLGRNHADKIELFDRFDRQRTALDQEPVRSLDKRPSFSVSTFSRGDNASALIHACAYADFLSIDRYQYDIVAVTGNSMGWYISLACAGALSPDDGFRLVNTMGTLMQKALIGGQLIYPFVDDSWREIPGRRAELLALASAIDGLYLSIDLGGMIVFGGTEDALTVAEERLTPVDRFPLRLANHAAFHTELQAPIAHSGQSQLGVEMFHQPTLPLIDGRGHTWLPGGADLNSLREYTLGTQVTEVYDFTTAVRHGLREFAPEVVILLGPGRTLGGAVAQVLIAEGWGGLASKQDFLDRQTSEPIVLAMGIEEQRRLVLSKQAS